MAEKRDQEVKDRLKSISAKVRDIEATNAKEVRSLRDHLEDLTAERDELSANLVQMQKKLSVLEDSVRLHEESVVKMKLKAEKAQSECALARSEADQLQRSLSHMEGLVKSSREKTKASMGEMTEMQQNYEEHIEELEGALHRKEKELSKFKTTTEELRMGNKELKALLTTKSEEVAMLQDVVQKECMERAQLKAEITALQSLPSNSTFFPEGSGLVE